MFVKFAYGHRAAEEEALSLLATGLLQQGGLRLGLDPFRNQLQFQRARNADNRLDQFRTFSVALDVAVVADLFLSLADCGLGKTPSFAQGPFDALDAVVPARLAETPSFELVLRAEGPPAPIPTPANFWPDPSANAQARLAAVLGSYRPGSAEGADGGIAPFEEHVTGHDPAAVLLARIAIPVTLAADAPSDTRPLLDLGQQVHVDNSIRPFIAMPGKWLGIAPQPVPLTQP